LAASRRHTVICSLTIIKSGIGQAGCAGSGQIETCGARILAGLANIGDGNSDGSWTFDDALIVI